MLDQSHRGGVHTNASNQVQVAGANDYTPNAPFGLRDQENQISTVNRGQHMRLESKGIDCDTIICGCNQNPKGIRANNGQAHLITNGGSYSTGQ